MFCSECCRSWYDLVRFFGVVWRGMSGHGEAQRLFGFWDCQHYGQHCSLYGQCRNMERMLGTNNADSTIMQFRMDRTDQFMICEFLFALQYMYSESLVSSSAFDKVKFQDHLLVGISLEPWQESLGPVPLLNIQAYGKNQNEFRYHIIKHHQYYRGDLVSGLVGLLVGPVKPFSRDVCRNQMRTDLMALLTHKLLLEVT